MKVWTAYISKRNPAGPRATLIAQVDAAKTPSDVMRRLDIKDPEFCGPDVVRLKLARRLPDRYFIDGLAVNFSHVQKPDAGRLPAAAS